MEEMEAEKFCLRWNEFETNISSAFKELRESKDFFDVTLVCEQHQLEAHKVILSACSPFFRDILRRNPHKHPLLYLKGVKFVDMQGLLSFMYQGEVNISQVRLNSFLSIAEDLKVKGLTQNGTPPSNGSPVHYSPPSPSTKKKRPMSSQFSQRPSKVANVEYSEADSQVPQQSHEINIKHKETAPESKEIATQSQIVATPALQDIKEEQLSEVDLDQPYQMVEYPMEGYEGQDEVESDEYVPGYSLQHMDPDLQQSAPTDFKPFPCSLCDKHFQSKKSRQNHLRSHNGKTTCSLCCKTFSTVSNLNSHLAVKHSMPRVILELHN